MIRYSSRNLFIIIFFIAAFGMIAGFSALLFSSWSLYRLLLVMLVLILLPVFFAVTGNVPRAFLVALIFAIPLDFSFSPFGDPLIYRGKTQPVIILYLYDFPLMGVIALWIWEVTFIKRKSIPKSTVISAAVLWIIGSIFSIYNSENLSVSWFEILRMVKLCIFMLAVSTLVRDKQDIRAIFIALFLSLIVQSFISVVQYLTGSFFNLLGLQPQYTGDIARVTGTLGWPNTAGAFIAALTSMGFILFISKADKNLSLLGLIAGLGGFIALILTYSRGAWLSFIIALLAGVLLTHARKWLNSGAIFRLVMISLVISAFVYPFTQGILKRLNQSNASEGAIADRIMLMEVAESMIVSHPLIGVGIDTFVEVMRKYDSTGISYRFPYPVHNVYLLIASETGLVGLGLFLVFTITIFSTFLRAVKSHDRFISASAICLVSAMIVLLVSNLADVHLRDFEAIFVLFWFLAGFGTAILAIAYSSESSQTILEASR